MILSIVAHFLNLESLLGLGSLSPHFIPISPSVSSQTLFAGFLPLVNLLNVQFPWFYPKLSALISLPTIPWSITRVYVLTVSCPLAHSPLWRFNPVHPTADVLQAPQTQHI